MKYHKLRIAWSVWWGVVAVMLCVLWVRSYWRYTAVFVPHPYLKIESAYGLVRAHDPGGRFRITEWQFLDGEARDLARWQVLPSITSLEAFHLYPGFAAPYWFLALVAATSGGVPWIRWSKRFSLRTLLIAMTLVAAVLGAIAWRR